jgi:hypothetical protein
VFSRKCFTIGRKVLATILTTLAWLILALCWTVFAWSRYSLFQNLAGLGISTLLFAAIVGVMWVVDQDLRPAVTILATLGWLSFALYWIGFAWSRYGLLQNGAALIASLLACGGIIVVLWQSERAGAWC